MNDSDMDGITTHNREEDASPTHSSGNGRNRNFFEDIHGEEDAFQFIGSTNQYPTTAKTIHAKPRATQCFGDMADSTFQQVSSDRSGRIQTDQCPLPDSKSLKRGPGQRLGRGDQI